MIGLDTKPQTKASFSDKLLQASDPQEAGTRSFAELLKGVKAEKEGVQNGALVLLLDEADAALPTAKDPKLTQLLSLLKGDTKESQELPLLLNDAVTQALSPKELKILIKDAKNYLKNKILSSEGFKRAESTSLPKTLKGLANVAKNLGIDISKITLEEVSVPKSSKQELQLDVDTPELTTKTSKEKSVKVTKDAQSTDALADDNTQEQIKLESRTKETLKEIPKELKSALLFKTNTPTELTTQQLVHSKVALNEPKSIKSKSDETLKLLLRGEKSSKQESGLTADFSVATARVLAPQAPTKSGQTLESLLRDDTQTTSKIDGLQVAKADSFEVKLNEAKQMTKYISQDVKTAIEDYKSPFTRVKVELNPARLGSVELTVIQRGKNLHINLSSNNAAINALAMNAQDLKAQLTNNGINNALLNFNNSSSNPESGFSPGQQQSSQQDKNAQNEYNYFEQEEQNEEILSSLEIVVPHYA